MRIYTDLECEEIITEKEPLVQRIFKDLQTEYKDLKEMHYIAGPLSAEVRISFIDIQTIFSVHTRPEDCKEKIAAMIKSAIEQKEKYM